MFSLNQVCNLQENLQKKNKIYVNMQEDDCIHIEVA